MEHGILDGKIAKRLLHPVGLDELADLPAEWQSEEDERSRLLDVDKLSIEIQWGLQALQDEEGRGQLAERVKYGRDLWTMDLEMLLEVAPGA
jgi:hypothetical protein